MSTAQQLRQQEGAVVVAARVPSALDVRLKAAARAEGRTRAEVVRRALEEWAQRHADGRAGAR
jgi:hypothetical protein